MEICIITNCIYSLSPVDDGYNMHRQAMRHNLSAAPCRNYKIL